MGSPIFLRESKSEWLMWVRLSPRLLEIGRQHSRSVRGLLPFSVRTGAAEPGAGARTRLTKKKSASWFAARDRLALRLAAGYGLNEVGYEVNEEMEDRLGVADLTRVRVDWLGWSFARPFEKGVG